MLPVPPDTATFEDVRKWAVERALQLDRGNKPAAARRLGIALKTLYNWLNRWELDRSAGGPSDGARQAEL